MAAIFKTAASAAELLVTAIAEAHSYDVPAIVVWPIDQSPQSYVDWVAQNSER